MANFIGIDIGSEYAKAVEIQGGQSLRLVNSGIFRTPFISATPQGGARQQIDSGLFWKEVSKFIPVARLKASHISINMPASSIMTAYLALPKMKKGEFASAVLMEARRKMISSSGPEHVFEWSFIGERIIDKVVKFEFLAVRSEKRDVENILNVFKDTGYFPYSITPNCCTIPCILPEDAWKSDADTVFVDLGAGYLNISIYKESSLVLTRNVAYGIKEVVQDLSRQLNLPSDRTEEIISEHGVPLVEHDFKDRVAIAEEIMRQKYEAAQGLGAGAGRANFLELRMFWEPHLEKIIHELRRSFVYYKEQSGGRRIEYIYFLGGGSQIKNLVGVLSRSIGGQCMVIDDKVTSKPIFANAVSLALSAIPRDKKKAVINFLPVELKRMELVALRRMILLSAGIFLIIAFAFANISVLLSNRSANMSRENVEFELARIKKITDKLEYLKHEEERIEGFSGQVEGVIKKRKDFYSILRELTRAIPRDILLAELSISKASSGSFTGQQTGEMTMRGGSGATVSQAGAEERYQLSMKAQIFTDYERAVKVIEEFKKKMGLLKYFSNIAVTSLKLEKISSENATEEKEGLRLTTESRREFTLTAEIVRR